MPEGNTGSQTKQPVATYIYRNELGKNHHKVLRYPNKEFAQFRWVKGRWLTGLAGTQKLPYNLPEILNAATQGKKIYLVEGEKDADTLTKRGYVASCTRGSPSVFQKEWTKYFKGVSSVVIIADRDDAGRKNAQRAYEILKPFVNARVFECTQGKDITEHVENGGSLSKGGFKDITLAMGASGTEASNGHVASNGMAGAGEGEYQTAIDRCVQWAWDQLYDDVPAGRLHNGRQEILWKLAEQLRSVDKELGRDVARRAYLGFLEILPARDDEGDIDPISDEDAWATFRSGVDNVPEGWDYTGPLSGLGAVSEGVDAELAKRVHTLRVGRMAARILDNEEAERQFKFPAGLPTLREELEVVEELKYTIRELHVTGGNTVLQAQYKTGKTTMLANLMRALVDEEPFLGEQHIWNDGQVAFWNYELSPIQFRVWLKDIGIRNPERATVLQMRGSRLPLLVPYVEERAVEWLAAHNIKTLIIDPFIRAYGGEENDNTAINEWLEALDVVKAKAGVQDLFMSHHMGRAEFEEGAERARGGTRLDDWLDHRWILTKDKEGVRYFRADGRDVEFRERSLAYDSRSRRLFLEGGSRAEVRSERRLDAMVEAVVEAVVDHPGCNGSELRALLKGDRNKQGEAIKLAIADHKIQKKQDGGAVRYYPW